MMYCCCIKILIQWGIGDDKNEKNDKDRFLNIKKGGHLERLNEIIPWDIFREELERIFCKEAKGPDGASHFYYVMMFNIFSRLKLKVANQKKAWLELKVCIFFQTECFCMQILYYVDYYRCAGNVYICNASILQKWNDIRIVDMNELDEMPKVLKKLKQLWSN